MTAQGDLAAGVNAAMVYYLVEAVKRSAILNRQDRHVGRPQPTRRRPRLPSAGNHRPQLDLTRGPATMASEASRLSWCARSVAWAGRCGRLIGEGQPQTGMRPSEMVVGSPPAVSPARSASSLRRSTSSASPGGSSGPLPPPFPSRRPCLRCCFWLYYGPEVCLGKRLPDSRLG